MTYLFVKAAHIVFVVAWMAAMLVYPRYKIHQMEATVGGELFSTMQDAAARLRRVILTPSLVLVWGLGLTMVALNPALLQQGWFHAKLALVIGLSGLHGYFIVLGRAVDAGQPRLTARQMRMLNELPFVILILVVVLAIVKPF